MPEPDWEKIAHVCQCAECIGRPLAERHSDPRPMCPRCGRRFFAASKLDAASDRARADACPHCVENVNPTVIERARRGQFGTPPRK